MTRMKTRTCVLMLLALLALFAGCKGESPTSPTNNPVPPSGGPVTPATGVSITLTASNPSPRIGLVSPDWTICGSATGASASDAAPDTNRTNETSFTTHMTTPPRPRWVATTAGASVMPAGSLTT